MAPELHQRMRKLFDEALERPADQRLAFLEAECPGDPQLVQAVQRLLSAQRESAGFLAGKIEAKRLGRYVISRELGRGAMGIVYEATDPMIGRSVALKVLRLESLPDTNVQFLKDRLFQEARSGGMLSHPGIVTVFDVGQEGDEAFIAMELVEGQTLHDFLAANPHLDRAKAVDILQQAAAALDYAHRHGIVHRDIKPANIILDTNHLVKIADFGIAKITNMQTQTVTGFTLGTPTYMSPEQIRMRKLDGRSDQFALAVVAFQLLTGSRPFSAESIATLVHQIVYDEPPLASSMNPALAKSVDQALRRGLAKNPADRYATCSEMVQALERALHEALPKPRPKLFSYLVGSGVAVAILLGGALIYRFGMRSPHFSPLQAPTPVRVAESSKAAEAPRKEVPAPESPANHRPAEPQQRSSAELGKELYAQAVAARQDGEAKASDLLDKAAKLGDIHAMVDLGVGLTEGDHADFESAIKWFLKAADKGSTDAMLNLGGLYYLGNGVPEDLGRALYWYNQAAQGGNPAAMYNLGNMYANGHGVAKDTSKAMDFYAKSAARGNTLAKTRLAALRKAGK
jgi:serine/threonine protein kinase